MSGARVEKNVGKNKDADRQIILWIIYKVYEVIDNVLKQITKDSKVEKIKDDLLVGFKSLGACQVPTKDIKIFNVDINNGIKAYQNKKIEELSEGFKKKYNSFSKSLKHSKSKKLVLNFFSSLEEVIRAKDVKKPDDVIHKFSECCNKISYSSLDKSSALFGENKVTNGKFREAVGKITETFTKSSEDELKKLVGEKQNEDKRQEELAELKTELRKSEDALSELHSRLDSEIKTMKDEEAKRLREQEIKKQEEKKQLDAKNAENERLRKEWLSRLPTDDKLWRNLSYTFENGGIKMSLHINKSVMKYGPLDDRRLVFLMDSHPVKWCNILVSNAGEVPAGFFKNLGNCCYSLSICDHGENTFRKGSIDSCVIDEYNVFGESNLPEAGLISNSIVNELNVNCKYATVPSMLRGKLKKLQIKDADVLKERILLDSVELDDDFKVEFSGSEKKLPVTAMKNCSLELPRTLRLVNNFMQGDGYCLNGKILTIPSPHSSVQSKGEKPTIPQYLSKLPLGKSEKSSYISLNIAGKDLKKDKWKHFTDSVLYDLVSGNPYDSFFITLKNCYVPSCFFTDLGFKYSKIRIFDNGDNTFEVGAISHCRTSFEIRGQSEYPPNSPMIMNTYLETLDLGDARGSMIPKVKNSDIGGSLILPKSDTLTLNNMLDSCCIKGRLFNIYLGWTMTKGKINADAFTNCTIDMQKYLPELNNYVSQPGFRVDENGILVPNVSDQGEKL